MQKTNEEIMEIIRNKGYNGITHIGIKKEADEEKEAASFDIFMSLFSMLLYEDKDPKMITKDSKKMGVEFTFLNKKLRLYVINAHTMNDICGVPESSNMPQWLNLAVPSKEHYHEIYNPYENHILLLVDVDYSFDRRSLRAISKRIAANYGGYIPKKNDYMLSRIYMLNESIEKKKVLKYFAGLEEELLG